MIKNTNNSPSLFSNLSDMLNQSHPLYQLSDKIDWGKFETAFQPLYCQDNGRPGKPIRLMCGLLILKHLRNLSDESLVEQWSENAYYQYFCGMQEFTPSAPCASSELVHFRKRIGEAGIELIFQESIRVNNENDEGHHHDTAFIDSTVQEKNVTYPTDAKLHKKIVKKVLGIVKKLGLPLRQSYAFVLKDIYRDQRFRNHPKNRKKALRADRRLRTIAGKRFIPLMSLKYNVSARAKNIRNTNSATRYPSYVLSQALFLEPCPFAMNMTVIPSSLHWNR